MNEQEIIEELKTYPETDKISLEEIVNKINEIIRVVNKENT